MNDVVKGLISQAQTEVWGNSPYNGSPEFEGYVIDEAMLVDLIVRECARAIRVDAERFPQGDLTWIAAMQESARVATKHFGVKE